MELLTKKRRWLAIASCLLLAVFVTSLLKPLAFTLYLTFGLRLGWAATLLFGGFLVLTKLLAVETASVALRGTREPGIKLHAKIWGETIQVLSVLMLFDELLIPVYFRIMRDWLEAFAYCFRWFH